MKKIWFFILFLLIITCALIWFAVFGYYRDNLRVIACDVGQGDAFLVTLKDFQILIDGGPNNKVLGCLAEHVPFWDRVIEVVILSHPQKDHFIGLIEVFKTYSVKYFLTTALDSGGVEWRVLKDLVRGSNTRVVNPSSGDKYGFGLMYLDILFPSEEYLVENLKDYKASNNKGVLGAYISENDSNDLSVVLILSYKNFDALFTGDVSPAISDLVAEEIEQRGFVGAEYIKIPHHGSKNGLTQELLNVVNPKIAVISVGKSNSYGHPHKEIMDMLNAKNIKVFRTDEDGEIVVESDGERFWFDR